MGAAFASVTVPVTVPIPWAPAGKEKTERRAARRAIKTERRTRLLSRNAICPERCRPRLLRHEDFAGDREDPSVSSCIIGTPFAKFLRGKERARANELGHRRMVFHDSSQFLHPLAKVVRDAAITPPGEPFQPLVKLHFSQFQTERIPIQCKARLGLVLIKISSPHGLPLPDRPPARADAHQV